MLTIHRLGVSTAQAVRHERRRRGLGIHPRLVIHRLAAALGDRLVQLARLPKVLGEQVPPKRSTPGGGRPTRAAWYPKTWWRRGVALSTKSSKPRARGRERVCLGRCHLLLAEVVRPPASNRGNEMVSTGPRRSGRKREREGESGLPANRYKSKRQSKTTKIVERSR